MSDPMPAAAPAPRPPYTPPEFNNVRYRGSPPPHFTDWASWQRANPLANVTICRHDFVETVNTQCCALTQMVAYDDTKLPALRRCIEGQKARGFRAIFVITKLEERELVKRLRELRFKPITRFSRRKCYDRTLLTMWIKRL